MLYYQLSLVLYLLRPAWSQRLNADFEDHDEHEFIVEKHPEFEEMPFDSHFVEDYGHFASLADLFGQIGHDERQHNEEVSPSWPSPGSSSRLRERSANAAGNIVGTPPSRIIYGSSR